jgi:hypothetical protein
VTKVTNWLLPSGRLTSEAITSVGAPA